MLPPNIKPHRSLRILFIGDIYNKYYSYHYYKFLKKMGHQLLTVCSRGDIPVVGLFDYKTVVLPHLQRLGFIPDLIIAAESPPFYWVNYQKLRRLVKVPMVFLSFDTALRFRDQAKLGNLFDYVFISQQDFLKYFQQNCSAKSYFLPYGCDPKVHQPLPATEVNDLAFAGTAWTYPYAYQIRIDYLTALQSFCRLEIGEGSWERAAAELYARSKMIFNLALQNGVNPRIFEALSYGKLLLTNRTQALEGIFADHVHLIFYDNLNHLKSLIKHYLNHPEERLKIAAQGHYKVWLKHTFYHRVDLMLRKIYRNSLYP